MVQCVHIPVTLSPSSIDWNWLRSDVETGKVTAGNGRFGP